MCAARQGSPQGRDIGMIRVRSPQDFWAGVLFIAFGVAGLWLNRNYAIGTASRMGPGYLPMALSLGLIVIGAIVAARGLVLQGPPIERAYWRPLVFVLGSMLTFYALVELVGLAISSVLATALAALASRDIRPLELAILSVGMTAFSVVLFVYLLKQPVPIWWFD
jgi:hypothetical protein